MRVLVLVIMTTMACGSSTKKATTTAAFDTGPKSGGQQAKAPAQDAGATITTAAGDDLSWRAPIYFPFDSAELTAQARDSIARLHDWLARNPTTNIIVEGHCDEQGTTEYNIGLGQRRAQAIVDYLARLGTSSSRLSAVSFGAERPAVDGHDEVAYAKNRRGEFRVDQP